MENNNVTKDSIRNLTEDLLKASDDLRSAKIVLAKAEAALSKEHQKGGSNPEQILVKTSDGWILLLFDIEQGVFDKFEKFESYGVVIS